MPQDLRREGEPSSPGQGESGVPKQMLVRITVAGRSALTNAAQLADLAAAAHRAQAQVLLAEGDPGMAAATLQRGIALWREAGAPYETARARLLLGEACGAEVAGR
jgi:hypothetical protein